MKKSDHSSDSDSSDSGPSRSRSPSLHQTTLDFGTPPEDRKEIPDVLLTPDESFFIFFGKNFHFFVKIFFADVNFRHPPEDWTAAAKRLSRAISRQSQYSSDEALRRLLTEVEKRNDWTEDGIIFLIFNSFILYFCCLSIIKFSIG